MDESLQNDEMIMNYLDGLMKPAEKAAFEKQLEQDPGLRAQLESLRVAIEAVKQSATRERVGAIHQEMMQEIKLQKTDAKIIGINRRVRYTIGVAAAVLLLFMGVQTFRSLSNSPGKLYNEAFVDYTLSGERGKEGSVSQIENSYKNRAYKEVINSAGHQGVSQKDSFLVAISFLQSGNIPSAITWLEKVVTDNPYGKDAQFYLSLAYLKNKDYQKALDLMLLIRNDANHPYHQYIPETLVERVRKLQ